MMCECELRVRQWNPLTGICQSCESRFREKSVKIKTEVKEKCFTCDGTGGVDSGGVEPWGAPIDIKCEDCDGSGFVVKNYQIRDVLSAVREECVSGVGTDDPKL